MHNRVQNKALRICSEDYEQNLESETYKRMKSRCPTQSSKLAVIVTRYQETMLLTF